MCARNNKGGYLDGLALSRRRDARGERRKRSVPVGSIYEGSVQQPSMQQCPIVFLEDAIRNLITSYHGLRGNKQTGENPAPREAA